ncbi:MAG: NFACT RNA binding domain-containing protein [Chitinispirillales bacterium]|jgi:predicted ribosome quality control (RQC) complex YloA/Tae2 family protein|nr:NFACT RNA binding domain-containing protein [Chitinispirillales bacterium]
MTAGTEETSKKDSTPSPADQIRAVRNRIRALLKHEEKKLAKQRAEEEEASRYTRYSQAADTLMADPSIAPRGTANAEFKNIHTGETETIALNPALDALENAELLYKKARKGRRGYETAAANVEETTAAVGKLSGIINSIEDIVKEKAPLDLDGGDIERVREIASEFLPDAGTISGGKKKTAEPQAPFKKYVIDGWEIYLGKNSEQNDELSTKFAKPSDIWLHVAAHAGSHVIIRHKKDTPNPPKDVVHKAAQLAVWYSKARHTSYAEVHVTEARFVRKRRHAPPGEVIAERCKAVRVEPKDPKLIVSND